MAVNIPNSRPSNTRNIRNIVVAGGDTPEQPANRQDMSLLHEKTNNLGFDLVQYKSACASTEDG